MNKSDHYAKKISFKPFSLKIELKGALTDRIEINICCRGTHAATAKFKRIVDSIQFILRT